MQKIIEAAIERGFPKHYFDTGELPGHYSPNYKLSDEEFYYLIFNVKLGFVDKLVGEGAVLCKHHKQKGYWCLKDNDRCAASCVSHTLPKSTYYHRQQMANMSLDEIITYLRGLV
jgi:hypothetical protein